MAWRLMVGKLAQSYLNAIKEAARSFWAVGERALGRRWVQIHFVLRRVVQGIGR
jgi:hypothetical protein